jgi:hypothetical protein
VDFVQYKGIMVQEIAAAAEEQSSSIEEVTASIEDVSTISEESAAGTEETSSAAEEQAASMTQLVEAAQEMAKLSYELQVEVNKFDLGETASTALKQIQEPSKIQEPFRPQEHKASGIQKKTKEHKTSDKLSDKDERADTKKSPSITSLEYLTK